MFELVDGKFWVLVTGDRDWTDAIRVCWDLYHIYKGIELLHGDPHKIMGVIQGGQGKWEKLRARDLVASEEQITRPIQKVRPVRGADAFARYWALTCGDDKRGLQNVITDKAEWDKYGKPAGPRRNQIMVDRNPQVCLAYHPDLTKSKGTKDCVKRALLAGIPVIWWNGHHRYRPVISDA